MEIKKMVNIYLSILILKKEFAQNINNCIKILPADVKNSQNDLTEIESSG